MRRLEIRKQERIIAVPPKHAGCKRKKCRLYELVKEKGIIETRMGELQSRIVKEPEDNVRGKHYRELVQEGKKRETVLKAIAEIEKKGSCRKTGESDSGRGNGRAKDILREHLLLEKKSAEAMIEECIAEKKNATSFDVILENYGYQREAERRLGRIEKALERVEAGIDISLENLMPAHKIEHIERIIEQAYA